MQSKHTSENNQTQLSPEAAFFTDNLRYSIKRRLENIVALGQEALEFMSENKPLDANKAENSWVLLEDNLQLIRNDCTLMEWLQKK